MPFDSVGLKCLDVCTINESAVPPRTSSQKSLSACTVGFIGLFEPASKPGSLAAAPSYDPPCSVATQRNATQRNATRPRTGATPAPATRRTGLKGALLAPLLACSAHHLSSTVSDLTANACYCDVVVSGGDWACSRRMCGIDVRGGLREWSLNSPGTRQTHPVRPSIDRQVNVQWPGLEYVPNDGLWIFGLSFHSFSSYNFLKNT